MLLEVEVYPEVYFTMEAPWIANLLGHLNSASRCKILIRHFFFFFSGLISPLLSVFLRILTGKKEVFLYIFGCNRDYRYLTPSVTKVKIKDTVSKSSLLVNSTFEKNSDSILNNTLQKQAF